MPLSVARIYLFTIRTDEALLSADFCWVELITELWVTSVEMRLVGGGHIPLTVGIEGRISVALFYSVERNIGLAVTGVERGPLVVGNGGCRDGGGTGGCRTGSTWRTLVAPVVHRAREGDDGEQRWEVDKGRCKGGGWSGQERTADFRPFPVKETGSCNIGTLLSQCL
jgi:hypothetical protein